MTQHELANFLGVAVPTVGRWETGRTPESKFLKMLVEVAINLGRPDLQEVFRIALLEDSGVEALLSISSMYALLSHAHSHVWKLSSKFDEFREKPMTDEEVKKTADEALRDISKALLLARRLNFNHPDFGSPIDPEEFPELARMVGRGNAPE